MKLVVNSRIDTAKFKKRLKGQMTIEFVVCLSCNARRCIDCSECSFVFW